MGKIYVVGIGPGGPGDTTPRVEAARAASDVLVGYTTYIQLVRERYPEKEIVVECREGKIIVRQKDDYDRLLEVLPKVFCLLDIPAEIGTAVLWEIKGLAGRYETEF